MPYDPSQPASAQNRPDQGSTYGDAYSKYVGSANDFGQDAQLAYNWFSNPFNGQNYGNGGSGGTSNGSGLTNPLGIDTTDQYGLRNPNMTEDVFNSMTPQEWAAFKKMDQVSQNAFIKTRQGDIAAKGPADAKAKAQADAQAQYDAWRGQVLHQLQDYADKMNMSVSDLVASKDPGIMNAIAQGAQSAGKSNLIAGMSGLGGMSAQNTQKVAMDSATQYQMQRAGLGLQATGMLSQGLQQQYMNYTQQQQYNQQMQLQLQQAQAAQGMFQYQQGLTQAGNTGGLVGGAIGAYFGGAAGAQAGYGIGSGVGKSQYPTYGGYNYQYPSGQSPYPNQTGGGFGSPGTGLTNPQ